MKQELIVRNLKARAVKVMLGDQIAEKHITIDGVDYWNEAITAIHIEATRTGIQVTVELRTDTPECIGRRVSE